MVFADGEKKGNSNMVMSGTAYPWQPISMNQKRGRIFNARLSCVDDIGNKRDFNNSETPH
jgi:hypothetical protein